MVRDADGYVPLEAIIGIFAVGSDGRATGDYFRNPGHGAVRDDFTRLEQPDRWLGWLPDTPARAVRAELAAVLAGQVEGAVLEWLKVVDEPVFLPVGVRSAADPERLDHPPGCAGGHARFRGPVDVARVGDTHQRAVLGRCRPGPAGKP